MTRDEHLLFCQKCLNRKMDLHQGIICKLTNKIANFDNQCIDFKIDSTVK